MNGAYRCTCRGVGVEGLRSGVPLCSSSPRLRRERRECSWMCHSTLSLPLFHSPPVALPLSLSLLLLFHFTFLLALFSSHPVPSTPNECPRASSSLLWELMPVVVRFRQERESGWERGRERGRHCVRRDICECIYMGLRESPLRGQDQPPSCVTQAAIGVYQRGINSLQQHQRMRREDTGEATTFHQLGRLEKETRQGQESAP